MDKDALPQNLVGNWIWMSDGKTAGESRQFFRRDFVIDRLPATAELWVAASTTFQLYLNGRLTGLQARPCPLPDGVRVQRLPVNFLLQQGVNQLAVQVFDAGKALANSPECQPGLWLQLDIDDEPFLWTNDEWMGLVPNAYVSSGIEQDFDDVQTEMVDFRTFPREWQTVPFTPFRSNQTGGTPAPTTEEGAAMRWKYPKSVIPIELMRSRLVPETGAPFLTEHLDWEAPLTGGRFHEQSQALWVNFRRQTRGRQGGVFTAETFVYSKEDRWYNAECYCNRPYGLFLNEQVVSEQAVPPPPVHTVNASYGDRPLPQLEYCPTDLLLHLQAGWNRFFLVLDAASSGHGLTLLFTDCPAGGLGIHTRPNGKSASGWRVAGPLKTPFVQIRPTTPMQDHAADFRLDESPAWDMAVLQRAFAYIPDKAVNYEIPPKDGAPKPLKRERLFRAGEKEYVVFDFGRTLYGYLCLAVQGHEGDIVDVICGEHLTDGKVLAFTGRRRSIATFTLSGGDDRWISDVPYGVRYIMFQVRKSGGEVRFRNLHLRASQAKPRRDGGFFECDDPVLNRIWKTGVDTLSATVQGDYLAAPCSEHGQYIADAMIQSWAAYHAFGAYDLSAQALEAFAATQLESGQFNVICPSGLLQILSDYSLLWVIWLARHVSYTGDKALLERLLPAAERLLRCYESYAEAPDGPLGDLSAYLGTAPFLDHDAAIERNGICTGLNALYAAALHAAAYLEETAGAPQKAHLYTQRAYSVAAYMRELTWDEEAGLFADCLVGEDTRSGHHAWQTNVLALYGGLAATDEQAERIWDNLFCDEAPFLRFSPGETENPYFKFFILETAFRLGKGVWALQMIRHYWGAMLEAGATTWWEMFSPAMKEDSRIFCRCFGYGTSPNAYLISELAGLRPHPDSLGMARVVFAPQFLPGMKWLKAVLPTPLGTLAVEWHFTEEDTLDISITSSYGVEVEPIIDEAYADRVTLNVSSSVIIRTPDTLEIEDEDGA